MRIQALRAAAVVAAAGVLASCGGSEPPQITVGEVGRSTVVEIVEAPATVVAEATAAVAAPATGSVRSLRVRDGQRVRAGQILLVVNSPQAMRTLDEAQQAAASASSGGATGGLGVATDNTAADRAAARAFAQARRAALLIPDRTLRRNAVAQIEQARAQYEVVQAQARTALAQLNAGVSNLQQTLAALSTAQQAQAGLALGAARRAVDALTVRAPISGTVVFGPSAGSGGGQDLGGLVGQLPESVQGQAQSLLGAGGGSSDSGGASTTGSLQIGSPVSSGDPLLTVTDVSRLSLSAEVDETDVLLVRTGIKADVELDAVPGATYRAVVRNVDLNPTTSSRGGVGYVTRLSLFGGRLPNGTVAPTPRPGMSAVASLRVRTAKDAVSVPAAAVFRDGVRDAVWLVSDGVAQKQVVDLGAQGEATVQVLTGVRVGDRIVVAGADQVREGQQVP